MADLEELAGPVEGLRRPSREVDALIAAAICGGTIDLEGRYWKPGVRGFCIAPAYTASIDAAMTLVSGRFPNAILHEAMKRLADKFALHMAMWPEHENYAEWLARFIAAAALRRRLIAIELTQE